MLNRIIHLSLNNRLVVLILSAMILVAGCIALTRSEIDIFPDLNAPTVTVMTEAPGMASEEVEKLVTFPVETAVNGASGVRRVRSASSAGFSTVWVEFDWETDPLVARQTVAEKIAPLAAELPAGVAAPVLGPQSSILGEMMIIGLTVNYDSVSAGEHTSLARLRSIADRELRPRLMSLGGVSQVSVLGGEVNEYRILLDPQRMRNLDVTLQEVIDATESINDNAQGGTLYDYGNEYIVTGNINSASESEIAAAVIRSDARGTVLLGDIATVRQGAKEPQLGKASVNAREAVLLTVTKQPKAGTITLTERIDDQLSQIASQLPPDVEVHSHIFRQSDFINRSVSNLQESLLEGALMVIIVLFFFLMNLRTTIISVIALPMSIIVAVLILRFMDVSINTMTLGGIAIAIGSLVDDAIVDVENVYKRLRQNMELPPHERRSTLKVVFEASKEVRMPIFNSSLIIVASFLPLFFLSGMEGRLLRPLGVAFIVALGASTIVALTLTPVLCSYLLGSKSSIRQSAHEPKAARFIKRHYTAALQRCMRHPRIMISGTVFLLVVAVTILVSAGRGFLPGFNEGSMTINVTTLPGISLEESDRIGRLAESIILETPEVETVARKTGRAELDEHSLGVNMSEIEAPYRLSDRSRADMEDDLRHRLSLIPGANIEIGQPVTHRINAMLSGSEAPVAVKIFGADLNRMQAIGEEVGRLMRGIDGFADINVEHPSGRPRITIVPRRDIMARYGITMKQFSDAVSVALAGLPVSQVYDSSMPYDITLKYDTDARNTLESLSSLPIDSNSGKIPLSAIAEIVSTSGPDTVNRENVKRRLTVAATVTGRDMGSAVDDLRKAVSENITLPEGYVIEYGGQFESAASATATLLLATLLSLAVIFMLLYGEYRNPGQSFLLLVNMPLAMIGGAIILPLTDSHLNIPAIIGFISLLGISTRNGMLLLSRYNSLKAEGYDIADRIRIGSADRLLPIVMTALTSALALIPLAIRGSEPGNEIQSPMATVILGGLLSSTILNLFIVPILYRRLAVREAKKKSYHTDE